jgi:hypothetical protein
MSLINNVFFCIVCPSLSLLLIKACSVNLQPKGIRGIGREGDFDL